MAGVCVITPDRWRAVPTVFVVLQAAPEPVDRPSRDHIELPSGHGMKQGIEAGSISAAFGTANAVIYILCGDAPSVARDGRAELAQLILSALAIGRDSGVQGDIPRL